MRSLLLPLLRNELVKAWRRKLPWFGLLGVGLLSLLVYFVAGQHSAGSTTNGWGYVGLSMQLVFSDLGLIFITVFSSMLLAEETGTGTIRSALAAPVHRWELYLVKAATGLLYMAALSLAALLFSAALAKINYSFGAVGDRFGEVYPRAHVAREFMLALVLSWVPLAALVMFGLFISTVVRSPGAAVSVAVSTLYLIDFTKHLVGLDPYIFTKYIGFPWQVIQQTALGLDYQWTPEVWRMFTLSMLCFLATFAAGLLCFQHQDLND
jgi:ABC-type transport system involved in multi-copper enzyme maturation permease subunit